MLSAATYFSTKLPKGWPAWLPMPANRPDPAEFSETLPADAEDAALSSPEAGEGAFAGPAAGGWFDSSLDLKLGLEVVDLGPVEWLDEWEGAFAA